MYDLNSLANWLFSTSLVKSFKTVRSRLVLRALETLADAELLLAAARQIRCSFA